MGIFVPVVCLCLSVVDIFFMLQSKRSNRQSKTHCCSSLSHDSQQLNINCLYSIRSVLLASKVEIKFYIKTASIMYGLVTT